MTSLFVDRRDVQLELESGAIVFRENGERIGTVPIAPLTRVFLRGNVNLSASLLGSLGEHGVGVVVLSGRRGRPTLLLARPHNDAHRRVAQIQKSLDPGFCLHFSRDLVLQKVRGQIDWFEQLRTEDMHARYELTHAMRGLQEQTRHISQASDIAKLRGIEGSAARIYFDGLKAVTPASLGFHNRNRRPPKDPFNALLSLTYTLVHSEIAVSLYGAGLDPYVGFYHCLDFGRESLASDLLEPLRHLADKFCLTLVRKQILTKDHFSVLKDGCLLGKAGRCRYYQEYEQHSEVVRSGIQAQIESTAKRIGAEIDVPVLDSEEADDL